MQLASYGTRAIPARYISRLVSHNPGPGLSRSIHIPLPRPALPSTTGAGSAQKLVKQTRTLLTRFFAHLTAPGLRAPPSSFPKPARSLHTAASRPGIQSIYANLSLPARHALSRGPFLPRAPLVPRGMTQVGLGTARNFSSARPIFQNLAQNVPVAGRAFWEAGWDVHGAGKEDKRLIMRKENYEGKHKQEKIREMVKPNKTSSPLFTVQPDVTVTSESASESDLQFEHYFPPTTPSSAINADLTTYLLIPLAPTPTSRLPLPASFTHSSRPLLPLPHLASIHHSHSTHALRVSSLFARLDAGQVWDKGVACDAYSSGSGDGNSDEGLCTVLRVTFIGWSAAEVRSIIGESGTGWCELYEVRADDFESESDLGYSSDLVDHFAFGGDEDVSGMSQSSWAGDEILSGDGNAGAMDPSHSFILPTLDFSSSFLASSSSPAPVSPSSSWVGDINVFAFPSSTPSSSSDSDSGSDSGSSVSSAFSFHDSDSSSSESWVQQQVSWHGSSRFGFGFSSEFAGRLGSGVDYGEGPREVMF